MSPDCPREVVDFYTITLLGKPFTELDKTLKILHGYVYEGIKYYEKDQTMTTDKDKIGIIENLRTEAFKSGLFSHLSYIDDKDTMKWILVKFLKESMEFLSTNEEARKTKRGTLVENWIDVNLNLGGNYDRAEK